MRLEVRCPISADSSIRCSRLPERRAPPERALHVAQPLERSTGRGSQPAAHQTAYLRRSGIGGIARNELVDELARNLEVVEPPERRLQLRERRDIRFGTFAREERSEEFGGVAQLLRGNPRLVPLCRGQTVDVLRPLAQLLGVPIEDGSGRVPGW